MTSNEGTIVANLFDNTFHVAPKGKFDNGDFVFSNKYEKRDHLYIEQEAFYNSILNNQTPPVTYDDGAKVIYVLDRIIESLDSGKEIELSINE